MLAGDSFLKIIPFIGNLLLLFMIPSGFRRLSKDHSSSLLSDICICFERKQSLLLVTATISIVLLFVIHSSTTTMHPNPGSILQKFVIVITISSSSFDRIFYILERYSPHSCLYLRPHFVICRNSLPFIHYGHGR